MHKCATSTSGPPLRPAGLTAGLPGLPRRQGCTSPAAGAHAEKQSAQVLSTDRHITNQALAALRPRLACCHKQPACFWAPRMHPSHPPTCHTAPYWAAIASRPRSPKPVLDAPARWCILQDMPNAQALRNSRPTAGGALFGARSRSVHAQGLTLGPSAKGPFGSRRPPRPPPPLTPPLTGQGCCVGGPLG